MGDAAAHHRARPTASSGTCARRANCRWSAIGAAVAAAIVVLGLLAWIAFQVRPAPVQPMTGAFNIAIADFGEIDPYTGQVRTLPGRAASQYLFDGLERRASGRAANVPLARDISSCATTHDPASSRAQPLRSEPNAAAALARTLNAHIVIYGNVMAGQGSGDLQVEFYVSPQASENEFAALLGSQALGAGLPLPASLRRIRNTDQPQRQRTIGLALAYHLLADPRADPGLAGPVRAGIGHLAASRARPRRLAGE